MPGISVSDQLPTQDLFDKLCYVETYRIEQLSFPAPLNAFFSFYPEYPYQVFNCEGGDDYFEGHIYNDSPVEVRQKLRSYIQAGDLELLENEVDGLDGEFLFVLNIHGAIYFVNDRWGKLPIYYAEEGVNVSRDIAAVLQQIPTVKLSQIAVAQKLLFGYVLGNRTLWEGIWRMPPHSLLKIGIDNRIFLNTFFKLPKIGGGGQGKILDELEEAMRLRLAKVHGPSLSLSAGLDSRLLAGITAKIGQKIPFTTFQLEGRRGILELEGASKIAARLGYEDVHSIMSLKSGFDEYGPLIAKAKCGQVDADMSYIVKYYQKLAATKLSTITGDGGDKFLVDIFPLKKISSKDSLVSYILQQQNVIDYKVAAQLSGIDPNLLLASLEAELKGAEGSYAEQYAGFTIRNRGISWLNEGEDRNRIFVWSTAPFYAPGVVKEAMAIPMSEKKYGNLFLNLFDQLPGELGEVVNPNWNLAPVNKQEVKKLFLKQKIKTYLPYGIVKNKRIAFSQYASSAVLVEALRDQGFFDLERICNSKLSPAVFDRILTIALSSSS